MKFKITKKWLIAFIVLAALLAAGGIFYAKYNELKKENQRLSNPQEAARLETARLKKEVASLIEIPTNEEPTVATVVDVEKLKGQTFFANAQNDDRVLIFTQARKAILYRPSTKKIIEVAPINIGDNNTGGSSQNNTDGQ